MRKSHLLCNIPIDEYQHDVNAITQLIYFSLHHMLLIFQMVNIYRTLKSSHLEQLSSNQLFQYKLNLPNRGYASVLAILPPFSYSKNTLMLKLIPSIFQHFSPIHIKIKLQVPPLPSHAKYLHNPSCKNDKKKVSQLQTLVLKLLVKLELTRTLCMDGTF